MRAFTCAATVRRASLFKRAGSCSRASRRLNPCSLRCNRLAESSRSLVATWERLHLIASTIWPNPDRSLHTIESPGSSKVHSRSAIRSSAIAVHAWPESPSSWPTASSLI